MSLLYDVDDGSGICVKQHDVEENRQAGYVVEIHFYDKSKAVAYACQIIRAAQAEAEKR